MRTLFSLILFSISLCSFAQELTVKSFSELQNDLSASTNMRTDNNDTPCALVKVQLATSGVQFEPNIVGKVDYKVNEYWVYLPEGSKHLKVKHPNFLTMDIVFADYGINKLERKITYGLTIAIPQGVTVEKVITQQYLVFQITPENAMVEVDGVMWNVDHGQAMKYMPFGNYDWKITAKNYHPEVGRVVVDNPNDKHIVNVQLRPAFGWIEVAGDETKDASVYIDNELVGKAPMKSDVITSGEHTVTIKRPMYKALTQTVIVKDGEITKVTPNLTADYCNVTLTVDNGAEIWVNGEKKGVSSWTGNLVAGNYDFETRKENYRKAQHTQSIVASSQPITINLPVPSPIYGSLNISTTPAMSKIFIDDKPMGETPNMINKILIGQHKVVIRKDGYGDYVVNVNIHEGQTTQLDGRLADAVNVKFFSNVPSATLYVDGNPIGPSSGTYSLSFGNHNLALKVEGYPPHNDTINVTKDVTSIVINAPSLSDNKIFNVNGVIFTMIKVQGGTFTMGATSEMENSGEDEKPIHQVTLSDYYIGEAEVTQSLWREVMGENPSLHEGDELPVNRVSWNDCYKFISKLNSLTGMQFRLPTEAEWEYAARGGNKSRHTQYSGSNCIDDVAWIGANSRGYKGNGNSKPNPNPHLREVKTKQPNELGIYDMSGNVWEWCNDVCIYYSNEPKINPKGPSSGKYRVFRGGSYDDEVEECRSSRRRWNIPSHYGWDIGLRLAL